MSYYTESIRDKVIEDYKTGISITFLSEKYDVSRPTIYKWLEVAGVTKGYTSRYTSQRVREEEDTEDMPDATIQNSLSALLFGMDEIIDGIKDISTRLGRLEKAREEKKGSQ